VGDRRRTATSAKTQNSEPGSSLHQSKSDALEVAVAPPGFPMEPDGRSVRRSGPPGSAADESRLADPTWYGFDYSGARVKARKRVGRLR